MDDFVATYFFLWLAFGIMIASFIWRFWVLYIASGLAWAIVAFYCITHAHTGNIYVWAFSLFSLAMALVMFLAYYWIPRLRMKRGEYTPFSTAEDWETPQGKKQFNKMWGKPHKEQEIEDETKSQRRKRGEWVDD